MSTGITQLKINQHDIDNTKKNSNKSQYTSYNQ